jgi:hypothetical protein
MTALQAIHRASGDRLPPGEGDDVSEETSQPVDPRLLRLRIELYTAAQMLKGADATYFWTLIDEIVHLRPLMERKP